MKIKLKDKSLNLPPPYPSLFKRGAEVSLLKTGINSIKTQYP